MAEKDKLLHSRKILPEVKQRMVKGESIDVIIGKRDVIYIDPETGKEVDLDYIKEKNLDPHDCKKEITTEYIKKRLEERLKERGVKSDINTTDFFVSAKLEPDVIEEIAGEKDGVEGIKGIHRIWYNKKTSAFLDESNDTIKSTAVRNVFNVKGKGIVWAVIDTGIDTGAGYLFNWDDVPGNDDKRLIEFLKDNLKIEWVKENAEIEKCEDGKTIEVTSGENSAIFELKEGGKVKLEIRCGETYEFTCEKDGGNLKIYDPGNPHIKNAVEEQFDFTGEGDGDRNGHGTHVAGIIASRSTTCPGIAPEAKLYDFKVLDADGNGSEFAVIQAMQKIRDINHKARGIVIHGANISLGGPPEVGSYGCGASPVCQEANRLVDSGVVVCVAASNDGYKVLAAFKGTTKVEYFRTFMDLTISDPGNAEKVITVGSVHKTNPHTYGISYFSSKGPTGDGRYKPDVVAPGEKIKSLGLAKKGEEDGVEMSGTSMATPHVSGALALFLSAKEEFIGQPLKVKELLMENCTDLKRDRYFQGAGLIDIFRTIQAI